MLKIFKVLAACLLLITNTVKSEQVIMAFGEKIPPFCFPETNTGIELEIIGEALAFRGHTLVPKYFPLGRVPSAFISRHVDAAMTDMGQDMSVHGGYYGDPAVIYENVFITLKERHIKIKKPQDLYNLSIISFQGALKRYPDWLTMPEKIGRYKEHSNQELQVQTLYRGRYDVVLSDRNIFRYFMLKRKNDTGEVLKEIDIHEFIQLNPLDYRPLFRSPQIRDDFNIGLQLLKQSGRFQDIYDKYLKE
nr:ABC transporter substrate-binding protein [Psychromonas aquimarina]